MGARELKLWMWVIELMSWYRAYHKLAVNVGKDWKMVGSWIYFLLRYRNKYVGCKQVCGWRGISDLKCLELEQFRVNLKPLTYVINLWFCCLCVKFIWYVFLTFRGKMNLVRSIHPLLYFIQGRDTKKEKNPIKLGNMLFYSNWFKKC